MSRDLGVLGLARLFHLGLSRLIVMMSPFDIAKPSYLSNMLLNRWVAHRYMQIIFPL
jgi:hypothetical protein